MPIAIRCPGCDQLLDVPESVRGKTIRCTSCRETFKVPAGRANRSNVDDDDDRPSSKRRSGGDLNSVLDSVGSKNRRRRDDDEDGESEETSGNSKLPIIVGGSVAGVGVLGIVLYFALGGSGKKQVVQAEPIQPPPGFNQPNPIPNNPDPFRPVNPQPDPFQPINNPPANDPFQPKPNNPPENDPFQPKPNNPVRPNPVRPNPARPNGGGGNNPFNNNFRPGMDGDEVTRFGSTPWKADVDAPKEPFQVADDMVVQVPMPQSSGDEVLYASTPSRFFVLGQNNNDRGGRALYNLDTMPKNKKTQAKLVGSIRGRLEGIRDDSAALSPDGKYLVVKTNDTKGFEVWSFDNGQSVRKIEIPGNGAIEWVDFGPTSDQVLLFHQSYGAEQRYTLQMWDISKGESQYETDVPKFRIERKHYALSPNRKYIAFSTEELGYVHRLSDGELVGVLPLPVAEGENNFGKKRSHVEGMAFSNNGKEVAALVKSDFDKNFWACSWDMATGKSTAEMDLTDALTDNKVIRTYYGPQIEYMPDDRAWFIRGSLIVDHDTGIMLAKRDFGNDFSGKRRRVLPNGMILEMVRGSQGGSGVVNNKIDLKGYDSAIKAARGDSGPKLDLKKANTAGVQTVRAAANTPWKAQPDIATGKANLGGVPVIPKAGGDVNTVRFSRPDIGQALVITVAEVTTPFVRKVAHAERYDLATKKSLGGFDLPGLVKRGKNSNTVTVLCDISPEGTRIAVRSLLSSDRVDLFDGTGKHVSSFLPFESDGSAIEWLGFVGEDRLLTLSERGKLILWEATAAKAVAQIEGSNSGPVTLSAGRKLLAWLSGGEVEVYDTTNLQPVGSLATGVVPADRLKPGLAFRTEAGQFAASIPLENNRVQIVTWDLKDGSQKTTMNIATYGSDGIQWCSDIHVLLGGQELIDLEMKTVVWQYTSPNRPLNGPLPDSRAWVIGWAGSRGQGQLGGVRLPDAQLTRNLQMAKGPGVQTILKPGNKINIRFDGGKTPEATDNFVRSLVTRFQQDGFEVEANAPITYVVTGSESPSGDTAKLTSMGGPFGRPGGAGESTINIPQVVGTASLVDGTGQALWSDKHTAKPSFFFRTFRGDQSPETVLSSEAWSMFTGWASSVRRPQTIYRLNGQLLMLPGTSMMTLE